MAFLPTSFKDVTKTFAPAVPERVIAPRIKFGVIGINHSHIYGMAASIIKGGGEMVSFYAKEADLAKDFATRFPGVKQAASENEILEDSSIQLFR
jgi:predicted dehydrogenase